MNNLVKNAKERFLREYYYVIVDEADSVLLDGAQMERDHRHGPAFLSGLQALLHFQSLMLPSPELHALEGPAGAEPTSSWGKAWRSWEVWPSSALDGWIM